MIDDFQIKRYETLFRAAERGKEISKNAETYTEFAADTAEIGNDVKEELRSLDLDHVQHEAARFVSYEAIELARQGVMESDGVDLENRIVGGQESCDKAYRAFILVDKLRGGIVDVSTTEPITNFDDPKRHPNPTDTENFQKYLEMPPDESGYVDPENLGKLYNAAIYVMNEEWISYRHGKTPPTVYDEVVSYLEQIGVKRV